MNKTEFLHILREKLSILNENELQDILNEYEQHIDMKAAGAMTEEAAIADFGDIDELTADILEAYHVRADYVHNKETKKKAGLTDEIADSISRTWQNFVNACKRGWKRFLSGLEKTGRSFRKGLIQCGNAFSSLFRGKKPEKKPPGTAVMKNTVKEKKKLFAAGGGRHEEKRDKMEREKRITLFSALGAMCRGCAAAVVWCVKALWNIFCACFGFMIGIFACICIFMLGTLLVLLALGYPFMGIMLGVLGLTMCTCSAAVFCCTLIIRSKKRVEKPEDKEMDETEREEEIIHA